MMGPTPQTNTGKPSTVVSAMKWLLFGIELVLIFFLYSVIFLVPGGASRESNLLGTGLGLLAVLAGLFCGKLFVKASGGDHTSFQAIASTFPVITGAIFFGITVLVGFVRIFVR